MRAIVFTLAALSAATWPAQAQYTAKEWPEGPMKQRFTETVTHLREDIEKVDDPKFKAMFETSAEVLGGLIKAFDDFERKNEPAWRE